MRYVALILTVTVALGASTIQEDSPHWDCHTMGNLYCNV